MLVSVVIPCHNAGRWIGDTLRSVADQTRSPHEIIVVDDGSTDDSAEQICRSGAEVRLIRANVRNAAAARNAGIEAATGDWIALLDADDLWYPNHLERAAEVLRRTNDVAYRAIYDEIEVEGRPRPVAQQQQPITETRTGLSHLDYIRLEDRGLYFGHSTCVIRRDRLREIGGYDPVQVRRHDIDMWLRLIHDRTWAYDAVPTIAYRRGTPGGISRSLAACDYFYLRSLLKNRAGYDGPAMDSLLAKAARRAVAVAFTHGSAGEFEEARILARPYLPRWARLGYAAAARLPKPARAAIGVKRGLLAWRYGHRLESFVL